MQLSFAYDTVCLCRELREVLGLPVWYVERCQLIIRRVVCQQR